MGWKYEIAYWDRIEAAFVHYGYASNLLQAILMSRKAQKKWSMVQINICGFVKPRKVVGHA